MILNEQLCLMTFSIFYSKSRLTMKMLCFVYSLKYISTIYKNQITLWIGNLALNQPCSFNEQCAGSPYASCLERYCSCIEGYTAMNSTNCVKSMPLIFACFFKIWLLFNNVVLLVIIMVSFIEDSCFSKSFFSFHFFYNK